MRFPREFLFLFAACRSCLRFLHAFEARSGNNSWPDEALRRLLQRQEVDKKLVTLANSEELKKYCELFENEMLSPTSLLMALEKMALREQTVELNDLMGLTASKLRPHKKSQLLKLYRIRRNELNVIYKGINTSSYTIGDRYVYIPGSGSTSSGKSRVYDCIEQGKPSSKPRLKAKISSPRDFASLEREANNYRALRNSKNFVTLVDYLPRFNKQGESALIIEAGEMGDVKNFIEETGPLDIRLIQLLAAQMHASLRALHAGKRVWTDFKLSNFVFVEAKKIKGVDLESAVPVGDLCVDFSPETMPPEVTKAFKLSGSKGYRADFSYDVWSFGMSLLHMYLGRSYFDSMTDQQILSKIGESGFSVDLSGVRDPRLQEVLTNLLDLDPQRRIKHFRRPSLYFRNLFG